MLVGWLFHAQCKESATYEGPAATQRMKLGTTGAIVVDPLGYRLRLPERTASEPMKTEENTCYISIVAKCLPYQRTGHHEERLSTAINWTSLFGKHKQCVYVCVCHRRRCSTAGHDAPRTWIEHAKSLPPSCTPTQFSSAQLSVPIQISATLRSITEPGRHARGLCDTSIITHNMTYWINIVVGCLLPPANVPALHQLPGDDDSQNLLQTDNTPSPAQYCSLSTQPQDHAAWHIHTTGNAVTTLTRI